MRLRRLFANDQLVITVLALIVGAGVGGLAILFRMGIQFFQTAAYGDPTELFIGYSQHLAWWHVLLGPAVGGILVGLFIHYVLPGKRPHGVADVIESAALTGGRMSMRAGIGAAVASAASLGFGASVGREGPAVHLGAAFSAWFAERLRLTRSLSRTLLGCGVAAAVASSFNAPIAGALFAHEVVVGHYALSAFAPIVVSSVTATAISRAYFGDFPAFQLFPHELSSLWEFPAFAAIGLMSGLMAIILIRGIGLVAKVATHVPGPPWLRPGVAGLIVGMIALVFPHVMGVGYEATDAALVGLYPLTFLLALMAAKTVATAVSLGGGFSGGIFSPALVIGAMLGGAAASIFGMVFPGYFSGAGAYALVGMGGMAAAVLGAPISTTLIVFEMTGEYSITIGVMLAAVIASMTLRQFHGSSFFTWQLERRGVDLAAGFEISVLSAISVRGVMSPKVELVGEEVRLPQLRAALQHSPTGVLFVVRDDGCLTGSLTLADLDELAFDHIADDLVNAGDVARRSPPTVSPGQSLNDALQVMRENAFEHIAVVDTQTGRKLLGALHEVDVVKAYNDALLRARREEHEER
ncbi:MAG: chloride channel protein [Rhodospirillales bacterium]|nr:chloride channel protein [Rhodospirillales bacterium]MCW8970279.1 chloride channel protein [Rhodospirillales bacterium]